MIQFVAFYDQQYKELKENHTFQKKQIISSKYKKYAGLNRYGKKIQRKKISNTCFQ